MQAADKKLNEMNRLADMAHFPPLVNAGATVNILLTLLVTYVLVPHFPQIYAPLLWVATVLSLNLLPVVILRLRLTSQTVYPTLRSMNFVHDQHKFSDWVYLAASANMAFWVLCSWSAFAVSHRPLTLGAVLGIAALATFSPVLLRSTQNHA